jgi:hypothetical protein
MIAMKTAVLAAWMVWSAFAATPPEQGPAPTVLGPKLFRDGDVIEIKDVRATSPRLEQGDSLTVRGRFRLESHEDAQLSLYVTQTEGDGVEEVEPTQTVRVKKGAGDFELKTTIKHRGVLHITYYSTESGKPFGGVYFGTRRQMKPIKTWNLGYYLQDDAQPR